MSGALSSRLTHLLETTTNPSTGRRWTSREVVNAINDRGDVTISYGYFSSLKVGSRDNPGMPVLRAIAQVLDVSEAELISTGSRSGLPPGMRGLDLPDEYVDLLEQLSRALARPAPVSSLEPLPPNPNLTSRDSFVASEVESAVAKATGALLSDFSDHRVATLVAGEFEATLKRLRVYFTESSAAADAADQPSDS